MITWEESDMFCFIGDSGFIDSSPDLDYTLVVLQIGLKIQSCWGQTIFLKAQHSISLVLSSQIAFQLKNDKCQHMVP